MLSRVSAQVGMHSVLLCVGVDEIVRIRSELLSV